jgi:hypothetical protein
LLSLAAAAGHLISPLENATTTHRPEDPLLIQVAFATERHARFALNSIRARPDLFIAAELNGDESAPGDLALLNITTRHDTRARVVTLTQGLHGIVVRVGDRLVDAGGSASPVDPRDYRAQE